MTSLNDQDLERELARRVGAHPLSDAQRDGILALVSDRRSAPSATRLRIPRLGWGTAAAAVVIVVVALAAIPLLGLWPPMPAGSPTPNASMPLALASPSSLAATPMPDENPAPSPDVDDRQSPIVTAEPMDRDFPMQVGGERVLTVVEAIEHVATIADDRPFLIGGWLYVVLVDCFVPEDFPTTPLLVPCDSGFRLEPSFRQGRGLSFPIVVPPDGAGLPSGLDLQVVVKVHVHDPRAGDCPPKYRERCERSVVVEDTVWHSPTTSRGGRR